MNNKESFKYKYTRPCLDWFEYVPVEIKPEDYLCFKLQRRFGPSWWLIGINIVEYEIVETQIGSIGKSDLRDFIEWAKTKNGNLITQIDVIASDFNIFEEIQAIMPKDREKQNNDCF